jgi:hypothetical protein
MNAINHATCIKLALLAGAATPGMLYAQQSTSPFKLVDVSNATGIDVPTYTFPGASDSSQSGGIAAADFDNDGDIDFFIPNGEVDEMLPAGGPFNNDILFINNLYDQNGNLGTATYTAVELPTIVSNWDPATESLKSITALWFDYDGDRLLDLAVFGDCHLCPSLNTFTPRLYRQRHDNTFEDVSTASGLSNVDLISDLLSVSPPVNPNMRRAGGFSAGDLNGDGFPELFLGYWTSHTVSREEVRNARVLQNIQGPNGREFVELPGGSLTPPVLDGMGNPQDDGNLIASLWQSIMIDLDQDGDLDIFAACDGFDNRMWINNSLPGGAIDLEYIVASTVGINNNDFDMGVAFADYDADGDFDVITTNITNDADPNHNVLYRNNLTSNPPAVSGAMHPVSSSTNLYSQDTWNWGTTFADLNNDGWQDLLVTNQQWFNYTSHVYMNSSNSPNPLDPTEEGRLFTEEHFSPANPFDPQDPFYDVGFPSERNSSAVIKFDYDRDGDLDVVETVKVTGLNPSTITLYENQPTGIGQIGHSLTVKPRGDDANPFALGAKITVDVDKAVGDDLTILHAISAGISFMGHEPAEAHFGLGDLSPTDTITITVDWLDPNEAPSVVTMTGAEIIAGSATTAGNVVRIGWCSYADFAQPFGEIDFFDLSEFLVRYNAQDPAADLRPGWGQFDFFDVSEFLRLYDLGCNLN